MREDRRSALKFLGTGLAGTAALMAGGSALAQPAKKAPPHRQPPALPGHGEGFLWGVAGAAYQVEGNNYASDLWPMEYLKPSIFKQASGDADDTWNRVHEDIALAARLGFNAYRMSVEWARIVPERGHVSRASLAYYRRVLESVRAHGMLPVVTYMHFTSPRWFAAAGGFEVKEGIAPYLDYARILTEELGDLIGLATTFNEPNLGALVSYDPAVAKMVPYIRMARKQAAKTLGFTRYAPPMLGKYQVQQPIMIEAHNRAREVIRKASGNRLPVGVTLSLNEERGKAAYVAAKRERVMLPWLRAEGDWVGVQNYTWSKVGPGKMNLPLPKGTKTTQMGYPYAPESVGRVVRTVAEHWHKPIYVSENGVATEHDAERIAFIDQALAGLAECLADGIDLRGYIHWSLLDNWEWFSGYGPKFGLVHVDRKTFQRTPKPSAAHLGQLARRATWARKARSG